MFSMGVPFVTMFSKGVPFVAMFSKGGAFCHNVFKRRGVDSNKSEEQELKINRLTWDLKHNLGECKTSQNLIILNTRVWNSS